MSEKYLLPCECGQSVSIGISQAGQDVTCACGRKLSVPSMRGIRQLEPVILAAEKPDRPTWNPVKGFVFGVGALLMIGGLVTAGHSYFVYTRVVEYKPSEEALNYSLEAIDQLPPDEVLKAWHEFAEPGLEPAGSSSFAIIQGMAKEKQFNVKAGLIAAAVGLVCTIIPLIIPSK